MLTEAHSIDPPNSAMDDNFVLQIPSFAEETYQKTHRGVFSNLSKHKAEPINFIKNAYLYMSSMHIKHDHLHDHNLSLVNLGKPVLIILGDQNTPELIDDWVNMVIVLRIVDASPDTLKDVILRAFKNKSCEKQGLIPTGSLVLFCLPELLLSLGKAAFNIQFDYLESWLTNFFARGVNIDLEPMQDNKSYPAQDPVFPPTKEYRRGVLSALHTEHLAIGQTQVVPPHPSGESAPGDPYHLKYEQIILGPGSEREKKVWSPKTSMW